MHSLRCWRLRRLRAANFSVGHGSTRLWESSAAASFFHGPTRCCATPAVSLLDRTPASSDLPDEIRRAIESDGDSIVTDLHVWQVGIGKFAAMVSIVAHEPKSCDSYRELLREHEELVHVTIETQHCREDARVDRRLLNG